MTWMKTVQNELNSHGLSWTEAVDLAQSRLLVTSGERTRSGASWR